MKRNGIVVFKKRSEMPDYIYKECYEENYGGYGGLRDWLRKWNRGLEDHVNDHVYVNLIEGHVVAWAMRHEDSVWIWTIVPARRCGFARDIVKYIQRRYGKGECFKGTRLSNSFWNSMRWYP